MRVKRFPMGLNKLIIISIIFVLAGCDSGCIFRTETDSHGAEICARLCPQEEANGDTKKDANGDILYGDPEEVNGAYCRAVAVTATITPTVTPTVTPKVSPTATPAQ